jgi:dTDP-4-amino-4,6-dideoxygalactose transaminase
MFIEKESKRLETFRLPRRFTSSARSAMVHILASCKATDPRGILLPAYIGLSKVEGSGVFDPVRQTGISHAFYKVNQRLVPDLQDVEEQLKTGRFQLVFLVHYFGCSQVDPDAFVSLCHAYGVKVIEDCAHTLLGGLDGRRLGTYGDYAIFSIHKSCGTSDGGFYLDHCGDLPAISHVSNFSISYTTLQDFANTDHIAASNQRLRNYQTVSHWVSELPGLDLFFEKIPVGVVPLNCPVMIADGKRELLYFKLVENGVFPTALYHQLISEISPAEFPNSYRVANNILNLPTHPDIKESDYLRYRQILERSVTEVFST